MEVVDFLELFADQERHGFADLAGSNGQGSIVVSERLLNPILAEQLRRIGRDPRAARDAARRATGSASGWSLAKPSFLPPLSLEVTIDKQPSLPDDPVLALTLSGMGGLLRFAGPAAVPRRAAARRPDRRGAACSSTSAPCSRRTG